MLHKKIAWVADGYHYGDKVNRHHGNKSTGGVFESVVAARKDIVIGDNDLLVGLGPSNLTGYGPTTVGLCALTGPNRAEPRPSSAGFRGKRPLSAPSRPATPTQPASSKRPASAMAYLRTRGFKGAGKVRGVRDRPRSAPVVETTIISQVTSSKPHSSRPTSALCPAATARSKQPVYVVRAAPDHRFLDRHARCHNHNHMHTPLLRTRPRTACDKKSVGCTEASGSGGALLEPAQVHALTTAERQTCYIEAMRPRTAPSKRTNLAYLPTNNYIIRGSEPHFCHITSQKDLVHKAESCSEDEDRPPSAAGSTTPHEDNLLLDHDDGEADEDLTVLSQDPNEYLNDHVSSGEPHLSEISSNAEHREVALPVDNQPPGFGIDHNVPDISTTDVEPLLTKVAPCPQPLDPIPDEWTDTAQRQTSDPPLALEERSYGPIEVPHNSAAREIARPPSPPRKTTTPSAPPAPPAPPASTQPQQPKQRPRPCDRKKRTSPKKSTKFTEGKELVEETRQQTLGEDLTSTTAPVISEPAAPGGKTTTKSDSHPLPRAVSQRTRPQYTPLPQQNSHRNTRIAMDDSHAATNEADNENGDKRPKDVFGFDSSAADVPSVSQQKVGGSKSQTWLSGRLALSKQASRFELPMDMKKLETMTPQEYLRQYCIISSRRYMLYQKIFLKHKDKIGALLLKDLERALKDVLINTIDKQELQLMCDLAEVDGTSKVDLKLFCGIAAMAERILYPKFLTEDTQDRTDHKKETIESADFCALEWKLHGVSINPSVRRILEAL